MHEVLVNRLGGLICYIKGLSVGSKDYTDELKTVECTIFLLRKCGKGHGL